MTLDDIKDSAERFAADELGFRYVEDAKAKSPRLFAKILAERTSKLCEMFEVKPTEHYTQSALF